MKKFIAMLTLCAFCALPAFGQEYGVLYTRNIKHITTKTTTHVATAKAVLYTVIINVSGAGTSWTLTIQDVDPVVPHILYSATVVTGTTVIELPVGVNMNGGIDVVTAGTTAGTADVFFAYR